MDRFLKSPTPLSTPCGSPNQWYSPINTPCGSQSEPYYKSLGNTPTPHSISHNNTPSPINTLPDSSSHEDVSSSGLTLHGRTPSPGYISINNTPPPCSQSHGNTPSASNSASEVKVITEPCATGECKDESALTKKSDSVDAPAKTGFTKTQIFTMVILAISGICSSMFGSLLAPFFPTEAEKKGVSLTWIGILFGSYQLVGFIASPILGAYLTVIGAKFMYVSGIFINSSCAILFGVLQWCPPGYVYIIMCFSSRSLEALGGAAIGTANRAIATHAFPHHVSTVIGILNACSCIGLMVGPPIGGILFQLGGFYLPFLVTGSSFMVCGFISWCLLPTPPSDRSETGRSKIPKWHLLKLPVIFVIGYIVFVGQFVMGFLDVTFSLHLQDVQPSLSQSYIGLIFLIAPVVVVIFAPIIGWIADKFKMLNRPILLIGICLASLGFVGLGPSPYLSFLPTYSLVVVLISLGIAGVGWAALVITYQEFVTAAKLHGFADTLETQGLVSGVYSAYNNFGAFLGPMVGGVMNEHLGFRWSSTVNAFMIAAAGILLLVYMLLECCCCPPEDLDHDSPDTERLIGTEEVSPDDTPYVIDITSPLIDDGVNSADNPSQIDSSNGRVPSHMPLMTDKENDSQSGYVTPVNGKQNGHDSPVFESQNMDVSPVIDSHYPGHVTSINGSHIGCVSPVTDRQHNKVSPVDENDIKRYSPLIDNNQGCVSPLNDSQDRSNCTVQGDASSIHDHQSGHVSVAVVTPIKDTSPVINSHIGHVSPVNDTLNGSHIDSQSVAPIVDCINKDTSQIIDSHVGRVIDSPTKSDSIISNGQSEPATAVLDSLTGSDSQSDFVPPVIDSLTFGDNQIQSVPPLIDSLTEGASQSEPAPPVINSLTGAESLLADNLNGHDTTSVKDPMT